MSQTQGKQRNVVYCKIISLLVALCQMSGIVSTLEGQFQFCQLELKTNKTIHELDTGRLL